VSGGILGFVLRRAGHAVLVMLVVSTATFGIMHAAPGGPSLLADPKLTAAERRAIETRLGLDQPLMVQYTRWLGRLARGDLGNSFLYQTPITTTIARRLPNTLVLATAAIVLMVGIGIPLGVLAAARPDRWLDRLTSAVSFTLLAVPAFWLGIMLIVLFAVQARILPAGGVITEGGDGSLGDRLRHLVLPALVLAAAATAELFRYARSAARTAFQLPFVRTARAKGLRDGRIRWRHVTRHALVPVLTVAGLQLPRLVGGAAITETVFSWPGMGRLGIEAALARDYPLVMGVTLLVSAGVLVANLLIDLAYLAVDPRIRHT
jgi:peptide/nickel transport system permease protein